MADWLDAYRDSVSWGDQINAHTHPSGIDCCWVEVHGRRVYSIPARLDEIGIASLNAVTIKLDTGCDVRVLFTDDTATAAQVEEAMNVLAQQDIGCGFLEPIPQVHFYGLLSLMSEGTLLESAVRHLQGGQH